MAKTKYRAAYVYTTFRGAKKVCLGIYKELTCYPMRRKLGNWGQEENVIVYV